MSLVLTGLDAANPRDFLATLGLLEVGPASWQISWHDAGGWRPTLHGAATLDEVVAVVDADRQAFASSPILQIEHQGKRDLKLPPSEVRALLSALLAGERDEAGWVACLLSELVTDNNGMSKPTGLHFTAGQQKFIEMWGVLQAGVDADTLQRDLTEVGPSWSKLPSMSWDSAGGVPYALRARDPSKAKRLSRPGREWLGLRGLALVPSAPGGPKARRLDTALIRGRWGSARMTWPVWGVPAGRDAVRSLLVREDWLTADASQREALGLVATFAATILRSDSGGYGSFTPAEES